MGFLKKAATAAAVVAFAGMAVAPSASAAPVNFSDDHNAKEEYQGCAEAIGYFAHGTWETQETMSPLARPGLLGPLMERLDESGDVETMTIPYPASFGGNVGIITGDHGRPDYTTSKSTGVGNTIAAMEDKARQCPDAQHFVVGFSQGADVAGEVSEVISNRGVEGVGEDNWLGSYLFSDPKRSPVGNGEDTEVTVSDSPISGGGILGLRRDFNGLGDKVHSFCVEGDAVCAAPEGASSSAAPLASMIGAGGASGGVTALPQGIIGMLSQPDSMSRIMDLARTHGTEEGHVGYGSIANVEGLTALDWTYEDVLHALDESSDK